MIMVVVSVFVVFSMEEAPQPQHHDVVQTGTGATKSDSNTSQRAVKGYGIRECKIYCLIKKWDKTGTKQKQRQVQDSK